MTYGEPDGPTPTCYRHPDRPTLIRCVRCNRPICPECMRDAAVGFQCPDDAREASRSVRRARTAAGARVRTGQPARWGPTPVTLTLLALNVIVYLYTAFGKAAFPEWPKPTLEDPRTSQRFIDWAMSPGAVHDLHEYQRMITSAFLHLSPVHLAVNMLSLVLIGPYLERFLGPVRFLAVYLIGGFGASTAIYLFDKPDATVAGASGALFGLMATALVFARRLQLDLQWLVTTIVLNFVLTFSISGISKTGHIGGFIFGGLAALALTWWPPGTRIVKPQFQAAGLAALVAVLVVATVVRTNMAL